MMDKKLCDKQQGQFIGVLITQLDKDIKNFASISIYEQQFCCCCVANLSEKMHKW
jgi:hypothetical protein